MSRITFLKNRHLGERCVVVANGPSLNSMDLSFLRREIAVGLNKIFLGFLRFGFYPRYYVAVNKKVLRQAESQIRALNCVKFISDRGSSFLPESALTYHINTTEPPRRFSRDLAQGAHEGGTVTHVALQVAYYLGFKEVVLIGLDHRFEYTGAPNEARRLDGPDRNHFTPDYFGHGQTWDNPDLAQSEESYTIARQEYERVGRRIIDATVNGACTIFEKASYRDLFFS
ncbi:6-hydroxymethylpterin diphosphokinase MptE-like protein [Nitrococcus mobilis]|nr:6-hydroxymethylpterin diphosphokinase MptE-like protein [Nitrococcus mobilis]